MQAISGGISRTKALFTQEVAEEDARNQAAASRLSESQKPQIVQGTLGAKREAFLQQQQADADVEEEKPRRASLKEIEGSQKVQAYTGAYKAAYQEAYAEAYESN